MANGGWYGTNDEWQRLEGPLLEIDPPLEQFATAHGLELSKNLKDYPERSLRWGDSPSCLIQIYLANEADLTWNMWLCCAQDRADSRYWRNQFAVHEKRIEDFRERFSTLLEESFSELEAWKAAPELLEFATKLSPMPEI